MTSIPVVVEAEPDAFEIALELLGKRWALRIVARLLAGPHRFSDLLGALRPLSAKILSQRLGELTEAGILQRRAFSAPIRMQVYELTDDGLRLEPVVSALTEWARVRVAGGQV